MKKKPKGPNIYPPGLNAKKVREIIAYYDERKDVDLFNDPEHTVIDGPTAWIEVPVELVPRVRKLIATRRKSA